MNLVMIGRSRDASTADTVNGIIETIKPTVKADEAAGYLTLGKPTSTFTDAVLQLLMDFNSGTIDPTELEQFLLWCSVERDGDSIMGTTEEIALEAFLKLVLSKGARIEV